MVRRDVGFVPPLREGVEGIHVVIAGRSFTSSEHVIFRSTRVALWARRGEGISPRVRDVTIEMSRRQK